MRKFRKKSDREKHQFELVLFGDQHRDRNIPVSIHSSSSGRHGVRCWVLIFSVTGYYGLFDLGIRSSVVRYVSKFTATNEDEELAKVVNTSLFSYSCIGLASMVVTLLLCLFVDRVFAKNSSGAVPDRTLAAVNGWRVGGSRISSRHFRRLSRRLYSVSTSRTGPT